MPQAWRMVKAQHALTAFSGEGAAKTGGRWNSRGVRVVYASATKSLSVLETLVHLNPQMFFSYVLFPISFDEGLLEKVSLGKLPVDWVTEPPSPSTKAIGDAWVKAGRSAALEVPSVIVRGEANYLFNPAHPDFGKVRVGESEPFSFDSRLLG